MNVNVHVNVKEYLSSIQQKHLQIIEQAEYIQRLYDSLQIAGIRYDKESVQTSHDPDKMLEVFSKIEEAEQKLSEMQSNFCIFRSAVIGMIHELTNMNHRTILNLKYIDCLSIEECAEKMHFSKRHAERILASAEEEFETAYLIL